MEPYQFKPDSVTFEPQADGTYRVKFELATFTSQTFAYTYLGINAENYFEIDVNVLGNEVNPIAYQQGETAPITPGNAIGVLLVAKKDGKRKGSISTGFP